MARTFAIMLLMAEVAVAPADQEPMVRLNTVGYLPDAEKRASFSVPGSRFQVVRLADGVAVFRGSLSGPLTNGDSQELLYTADFSSVKAEGVYQVQVEDVGSSAPFRISKEVYREPFRTVTRAMYLWRCGTAVRGIFAGNVFAHGPCHTNDASLRFVHGDGHQNGTGGWHDAGDYNKYVVNAGVSVGAMFRAWEDFGPAIRSVSLDLPESGGALPDFLAELKWELDWLLSMQGPDGEVYHKLSTLEFGGFVMPERESQPRYFTPWSSAATADFVAITAIAARTFRSFDADYAERCSQAARNSYAFLQANPGDHRADLTGFSTGSYQSRDPDERLWAAAEWWETTGDPEVLVDCERCIRRRVQVDSDFDWGNVANLGLITYAFATKPGRDESLVTAVRSNLVVVADGIVAMRERHGYERPLGTRYYWGCNGGVARQVIILYAAFRAESKPAYRRPHSPH